MKRFLPIGPKIGNALLAMIWWLSLLGQFGRFESPVGKISFYEIVIVTFLPVCLAATKPWQKWQRPSRLFLSILAFLTWAATITIFRAWQYDSFPMLLTGGAYVARWTLYFFFGLAFFWWRKARYLTNHLINQAILAWLILQAVFGLGQYLFYPDTRILLQLGWDEHLNRAFGTLLDPGFFGLFMAIGALKTYQLGLAAKKIIWQQGFAGITALFLLALTLSYSRASYLAFIVGVMALAWQQRSRKILLAIPLLVMAISLSPKDGGGEGQKLLRTNSVAARVEVAEQHTRRIRWDEIVFGRGVGSEVALKLREKGLLEDSGFSKQFLASAAHAQSVDSLPLYLLTQLGAIGCIIALWTGRELFLVSRKQFILSTILVHSIASLSIFYSAVLLLMGGEITSNLQDDGETGRN